MPTMQAVLKAPLAIAYWLGIAGKQAGEHGGDVVFLYHGTPRGVASQLERQLRYLRRVFALVPVTQIAASARELRPAGQRRQAAICFDDGLRTNVAVAYPILRALGVPATFFVCPGLIEGRKWLWTHEMRRRLSFAGVHVRGELASELDAPADTDPFVQWMKKLPFAERLRVERRVRQATPRFRPTQADCECFDLAQWDELRALDDSVVAIGSHSMTHPILPKLSEAEIEAELRDSRHMIEARLGRPVEAFSYPNGDVDWRTLAAVRRHYRAAVAHQSGVPLDPHLLPSVHLPRGVLRLTWALSRDAATSAQAARPRFAGAGTPAA